MSGRTLRVVARAVAPAAALLLAALGADAQSTDRAPKRPRLEADAEFHDPRDWRSYLDCGVTATKHQRAEECLYWATRLDPARPEPRYAQWWLADRKDTAALRESVMLDPFMYDGRVLNVEARRTGAIIESRPSTHAWSALGAGDYFGATAAFEDLVATRPQDLGARWGMAVTYYYRGRYDSSAAQLRVLEAGVQKRQQERFDARYRSTEFVDYMEAAAYAAAGRRDSARSSLQRALTENLAFYHAHMQLADLDLQDGDTASAAHHWEEARGLYGNDVVARRRYALFLLATGRPADAEAELRAVLAAEPYWVDARRDLGRALDAQGDSRRADAARAYEDYLKRAPADPAAPRKLVETRLRELRGA